MFVIGGYPRSATVYMTRLMRRLGHSVGHEHGYWHENRIEDGEKVRRKIVATEGIVSFRPRHFNGDFSPILHQVRDPLKVAGSACTMGHKSMVQICDFVGTTPPRKDDWDEGLNRLFYVLITYPMFCQKLDEMAEFRYRIEDFDKMYPKIFEYLSLPVPDKLPEVPKTTNTRENWNTYKSLTKEDIYEFDSEICNRFLGLRERYGYADL